MWLSRAERERELAEREHERSLLTAELTALRTANAHLAERETQARRDVDWLHIRVNALERERSALLMKLNGVIVPTPTIGREQAVSSDEQHALNLMDIVGKDVED